MHGERPSGLFAEIDMMMFPRKYKNNFGFGLIGIVIVLAVLAIVGGGYFYYQKNIKLQENAPTGKSQVQDFEKNTEKTTPTNSQIDTSTWKTYRNEKYGFEVKYPSNWQISERNMEGLNPFVVLGNPLEGLKVFVIYIFFKPNPNKLSSEDYVSGVLDKSDKEFQKTGIGVNLNEYRPEPIVINSGITGYRLNGVFLFDHSAELIYFTRDVNAYNVSFPVAEENTNLFDPAENNKTARQILSTFKFVQ
ncbi:MAG: hypothetical protein UW30_C0010G0014 [Candidatus Giovannonibacteria bacterium GW2011_GWA2_44_13b]|uniref:PsbP C-terminal domain-containing protein n=2 Tax=Candidatus Giovannoniibacteriota TaxID=1752738 RepID=A0A0G1H442_9BACT|nr:MAG: hypothetical protein UW30_C0010G0014 [Candidatus Giovannonibacteria bacterium GW2011_GWA2_44_13b]